jgi:hypothetical protein
VITTRTKKVLPAYQLEKSEVNGKPEHKAKKRRQE